jgi:serine/threonine-protein kinase
MNGVSAAAHHGPGAAVASSGRAIAMSDVTDRVPESPRQDLSGRQMGPFRLLRRLGRGAMAEVYLAEQAALGRQVAVKVLKGELAADETYVRRFQREAKAAAALVHANIVQIYDVGCVDGRYYIAQEYVQGDNLRQWLNRNGPLDLDTALIMMRQVVAALAKAAEHGIIHRDIKPENILVTPSGEVKVADFGLARVAGAPESTTLTQVGMTMGTPLYMSPEQIEGRPLDPRSDLYSFGVTCYQMLAGHPPFSGETPLAVAVQHLKKTPEALERVRPDLPPGLCRVVHRMLAKSAEQRYQSPGELLGDLRQLSQEHLGQWPDDLAQWQAAHPEWTARAERTQRLDSLMKTAAVRRVRRPRRWLIGTLGVATFLLGVLLARAFVAEPPLLANVAHTESEVARENSVVEQILRAKELGTAAGWRAVMTHYPEETYWVNFARKQLALVSLHQGDDEQALELFETLAENTEPELRAVGLVGQAYILTQRQQYEESAKRLNELQPIRNSLFSDPAMRTLLQSVIAINRRNLSPSEWGAKEWEQWLSERSNDDG